MGCYFPWDFKGLLVTLSLTFLSQALLIANISIWKHLLCSVLLSLYCAILQGTQNTKKTNMDFFSLGAKELF